MREIKIKSTSSRVKPFAYMSVVAMALLVSLGSCSDDNDEPDVPEQVLTVA